MNNKLENTPIKGEDNEWILLSNGNFEHQSVKGLYKRNNEVIYDRAINWIEYKDLKKTNTSKFVTSAYVNRECSDVIRRNTKITLPFIPKTFDLEVERIYTSEDYCIENKLAYSKEVKEAGDEIIFEYYYHVVKDINQYNEIKSYYPLA